MIADDMIIAGKTSEEHDQILQQVMETARAKNIRFNKGKIQFKIDSVKYMGHIGDYRIAFRERYWNPIGTEHFQLYPTFLSPSGSHRVLHTLQSVPYVFLGGNG